MGKVSLPTLTWNMTSEFVISGSGSPTKDQMLEGIQSAFASATYWEVYTPTTLTGSTYFLEVGPKSSSAIYNKYRILFCAGIPSGSSGNGPIRSVNESTSQYANTEGIWVSFLAGSGSLTNPCPNGPGFNETYGPNQRWSGWWHVHYNIAFNGYKGEKVYLYESDEIVSVAIENTTVSNRNLLTFGALIYPFSDSVAESDGRIYGMYNSPGTSLSTAHFTLHGNNNGWMTSYVASSPSSKLGGFRPITGDNSGSLDLWWSSTGHTLHTSTTRRDGDLPDKSLVLEPQYIYRAYAQPYYPLGQVRQVYALPNRETNRTQITDSDGVVSGYTFNPAVGSNAGDTIFYGNR